MNVARQRRTVVTGAPRDLAGARFIASRLAERPARRPTAANGSIRPRRRQRTHESRSANRLYRYHSVLV